MDKMQNEQPVLLTDHLSIGYDTYTVQQNLMLQVQAGELICVLGTNGCGKSTLFRTLAGMQPALHGEVSLAGKRLSMLSDADKARILAVVLTDRVEVDNATVHDVVAMGRYPYSSWLGGLSDTDKEQVRWALEQVHLWHKHDKMLSQLSDGECQRAMIAKALAQDTPLIFLDEPTAHLDVPNRMEIMLLLRRLAHCTGKAVVLSTHELDLALQAADKLWLMKPQEGVCSGIPEDLVLNGQFAEAFCADSFVFNLANGNFSINYTCTTPVHITGNPMHVYWTTRALARMGFCANEKADTSVEASADGWWLNGQKHNTLESLLTALTALR